MNSDAQQAFVVIAKDTLAMIGIVEFRDIFMFDFKNSYMTYYAFHQYLRQGFMKSGVLKAVDFAFKKLRLQRLEANIQPENKA